MGRGLDSFDRFDWPSLLAGRDILLCAARHAEALKIADGLEAAGARVTIVEDQTMVPDRLARGRFSSVIVALDGDAGPSMQLCAAVRGVSARLVLLAPVGRHAALRTACAEVELAERTISERALVLFLVGTPDE
ncbi:hypothetical protein [Jiella pacifica]|uniref:RCK N-terminal domain-containing protein n=1 Tax=Jiella pacifica TaxID=2696469 RepID=A0A6N9TF47_9HYPH|nr:hypothetical protein [Jiella pacifica]NDW07488.1 hypothetical protein [Jiella pacifica]